MCGICGIVSLADRGPTAPESLHAMTRRLAHRGPDALGVYRDERAALGHARLSVIDLETGAQPMTNEDGSLWIVFNGEIYNHVELRPQLESRGHRFRTRSDTEVLLHLYEELGAGCLDALNGPFAFAIWDRRRHSLFLARDRVGIRPLYYTETDGRFIFASEVKSLAAAPGVELAFDPVGLGQVFRTWSAIPPRTVFRGVQQLPPGHCLHVSAAGTRVERYWSLPFSPERVDERPSADDWADELRAALARAVQLRMRADVPVAAYVSGGLDSSLTGALIRRHTDAPLDTFSVRFADPRFDEGRHQEVMAAHMRSLCGDATHHHSVTVGDDQIAAAFPEVVWHTETPVLRTASVPLHLLSSLVRDTGLKVVVTGEGADEALAGYEIFKEARVRRFWARSPESALRPLALSRLYPYMERGAARRAQPFWRRFFAVGLEDTDDPFYSHTIRWHNTTQLRRLMRPELAEALASGEGFAASGDELADLRGRLPDDFDRWAPLSQAQYVEMATFMSGYLLSSQGDRVSLSHGIEGRYPFLDHEVVELCGRIPTRHRLKGLEEKHVLRRLARGLVPEELRRRRKQPFRAPDAAPFLTDANLERTRAWLAPESLRAAGVFDPPRVARLLERCVRSRARGTSARDDMALVGVLSTQLLHTSLMTDGWRPASGPAPPLGVAEDHVGHPIPAGTACRQPGLETRSIAVDAAIPLVIERSTRASARRSERRDPTMKEQLREYVLENFLYGAAPGELDDDASFLESGVLDSTGVMELIVFVEDEFDIAVEDHEMVPENLDSVNRVCAFVTRKRTGGS